LLHKKLTKQEEYLKTNQLNTQEKTAAEKITEKNKKIQEL
jgi:hypothetical protein